ncbi:hypothetical protein MXB_5320 [Myxobolus squamalis]|nr:hypothetical protein MXB_5320 [Myxobolus squamalis]
MLEFVHGPVSQNALIAMCGLAKVFIGQIVEEALDLAEQMGYSGPLQPRHIVLAINNIQHREPYFRSHLKRPNSH